MSWLACVSRRGRVLSEWGDGTNRLGEKGWRIPQSCRETLHCLRSHFTIYFVRGCLQMVLAVVYIRSDGFQLLWVQVKALGHEEEQVARGGGHSVALQLGPLLVVIGELRSPGCCLRRVTLSPGTTRTPVLHHHQVQSLLSGHVAVNFEGL